MFFLNIVFIIIKRFFFWWDWEQELKIRSSPDTAMAFYQNAENPNEIIFVAKCDSSTHPKQFPTRGLFGPRIGPPQRFVYNPDDYIF
jgi:hypothetical protein